MVNGSNKKETVIEDSVALAQNNAEFFKRIDVNSIPHSSTTIGLPGTSLLNAISGRHFKEIANKSTQRDQFEILANIKKYSETTQYGKLEPLNDSFKFIEQTWNSMLSNWKELAIETTQNTAAWLKNPNKANWNKIFTSGTNDIIRQVKPAPTQDEWKKFPLNIIEKNIPLIGYIRKGKLDFYNVTKRDWWDKQLNKTLNNFTQGSHKQIEKSLNTLKSIDWKAWKSPSDWTSKLDGISNFLESVNSTFSQLNIFGFNLVDSPQDFKRLGIPMVERVGWARPSATWEEESSKYVETLDGKIFLKTPDRFETDKFGGYRGSTYNTWKGKRVELPTTDDFSNAKIVEESFKKIVKKEINKKIAAEVAKYSAVGLGDADRLYGKRYVPKEILIVADGNLTRFIPKEDVIGDLLKSVYIEDKKSGSMVINMARFPTPWIAKKHPEIVTLQLFFEKFVQAFNPKTTNPLLPTTLANLLIERSEKPIKDAVTENPLVITPLKIPSKVNEIDIQANEYLKNVRNKFVQSLIKIGPDLYYNQFDVLIAYNKNIAMIGNGEDGLRLEPDLHADVFAIRTCTVDLPSTNTERDAFQFLTRTIPRQKNKINKEHKSSLVVKVDQLVRVVDIAENLSGRRVTLRGELAPQHLNLWAPTPINKASQLKDFMVDIYVPIRFGTMVPFSHVDIEIMKKSPVVPTNKKAPLFYVFEDVRFLGIDGSLSFNQGDASTQDLRIPFIFRRSYWVRSDLTQA